MGVFINVEVKPIDMDAEAIARLCPVDIFEVVEGQLTVKPENEDECTLCELCLKAAPPDAIRIHKTYKDEILISTGEA